MPFLLADGCHSGFQNSFNLTAGHQSGSGCPNRFPSRVAAVVPTALFRKGILDALSVTRRLSQPFPE